MSLDPAFPLPEPDFLWLHEIVLFKPVQDKDARGKTTYVRPNPMPDPVLGYLTSPDPREDTTGFVDRQVVDAVSLLSYSIDVSADMYLESHAANLTPGLAGTYRITAVRSTGTHWRLLLSRNTDQWAEFKP